MRTFKAILALSAMCFLATPPGAFASSHREAPITALDTKADVTDTYAFVSYDHPDRVTFVMNVDPLLVPENGPNYFPFDPDILYEIKIDNSQTANQDIVFQFRYTTEIRLPDIFTGFLGTDIGRNAPPNSPPPVAPGTPVVPRAITALDGAGSEGFSLRQHFTVTMVRGKNGKDVTNLTSVDGRPLIAVPTFTGPRTMPSYDALAQQGIYTLQNNIRVFTGTVADPFFIDLGAAFDTFNFRATGGTPGAATPANDSDDQLNTAPNLLSGFNVNTITLEVPITLLTSDGQAHPSTDPRATIGFWATTSRPQTTVRKIPDPKDKDKKDNGPFTQIQRLANPLTNELIIGTGDKDFWSMSEPRNDSQFQFYFNDPHLARILNAIFLFNIPPPPRNDLAIFTQYQPPIAAPGTPRGPIADLLRLNTGVPPTPQATRRRLGLLAGDPAGFPNGRRLTDDAIDIYVRIVGGGVLVPGFNLPPNNLLSDGVNAPDVATQEVFPYSHFAYSGRDSRHIDPSELGCGQQPTVQGGVPPNNQGGTTLCPVQ